MKFVEKLVDVVFKVEYIGKDFKVKGFFGIWIDLSD